MIDTHAKNVQIKPTGNEVPTSVSLRKPRFVPVNSTHFSVKLVVMHESKLTWSQRVMFGPGS